MLWRKGKLALMGKKCKSNILTKADSQNRDTEQADK